LLVCGGGAPKYAKGISTRSSRISMRALSTAGDESRFVEFLGGTGRRNRTKRWPLILREEVGPMERVINAAGVKLE